MRHHAIAALWVLVACTAKPVPESLRHQPAPRSEDVAATPKFDVAAPVVAPDPTPPAPRCPDPASGLVDVEIPPSFGLLVAHAPSGRVPAVLDSGTTREVADGTCVRTEGAFFGVGAFNEDDFVDVSIDGASAKAHSIHLLTAENSTLLGSWRFFHPLTACGDVCHVQLRLIGERARWLLDDNAYVDPQSAVAPDGSTIALSSRSERLFLVDPRRGRAVLSRGTAPAYSIDGALFSRSFDAAYEIKPDGYALMIVRHPIPEEKLERMFFEGEEPEPIELSPDGRRVTIRVGNPHTAHRPATAGARARFISLLEGPARELADGPPTELATGSLVLDAVFDGDRAKYVAGNSPMRRAPETLATRIVAALGADEPTTPRERHAYLVALEIVLAAADVRGVPELGALLDALERDLAELPPEDEDRCHAEYLLVTAGRSFESRTPAESDNLVCRSRLAIALARRGASEKARAIVPTLEQGSAILVSDTEADGANIDRAVALLALVELAPRSPSTDALAISLMERRLPEGWETPTETALALLALMAWADLGPADASLEQATERTLARAWNERARALTSETAPFPDDDEDD